MYRKDWIAVLTAITIWFVVTLAVMSVKEHKPSVWLTDKEVDELVYRDMLEMGFVDPETGKLRYD